MHGGGGEERQRVREHPEREKQGPGLMGVLVRVRVLFPDSIADPGQSLPLEQHLENFIKGPFVQGEHTGMGQGRDLGSWPGGGHRDGLGNCRGGSGRLQGCPATTALCGKANSLWI